MRHLGLALIAVLPFIQGCETPVTPVEMKISSSKIINGSRITDENPLTKSIVLIQNTRGSYCTGSLIASNVVLTAAHCMKEDKPEDVYVSLGSKIGVYDSGIVRINVKNIFKHENWFDVKNDQDDVALIELVESLDESYPTISLFDGPLAPDYEVFPLEAYGFSLFTQTKNIDMTDYFKDIWKESFRSYSAHYGTHELNGKLLSANENPYKGSGDNYIFVDQLSGGICSGDSGGPMMINIDGEKVQIGINDSIIDIKGSQIDCSSYSVSTFVNPYIKWINDTLEAHNLPKIKTKKFTNDLDIAKTENPDTSCAYSQRNVSNFLEASKDNIKNSVCDEELIKNLKEYVVYGRDYCVTDLSKGFRDSLDVTLKSLEANCVVKTEETK